MARAFGDTDQEDDLAVERRSAGVDRRHDLEPRLGGGQVGGRDQGVLLETMSDVDRAGWSAPPLVVALVTRGHVVRHDPDRLIRSIFAAPAEAFVGQSRSPAEQKAQRA